MSGESNRRSTNRRRFVQCCAVGAAGALGSVVGLSTAGARGGDPAGSGGGDAASAGARDADAVAGSPPAQSDPEETVERLEAELARRRRERRDRRSTMPSATRAAARAVGLDARPGVAVLNATTGSLGTAWAVDEDHLLTVAHNVPTASSTVECWSLAGESYSASVVGVAENQRPDVALLETEWDLSPLETGSSGSLGAEDTLVQVGHPGNFGYWVLAAGPYLRQDRPHAFASDVPILIGNSGSPVLDLDGTVVGISMSATITPKQEDAWGEPFRDGTVLHEPVRPEVTTFHVPIESALDRVEAWT